MPATKKPASKPKKPASAAAKRPAQAKSAPRTSAAASRKPAAKKTSKKTSLWMTQDSRTLLLGVTFFVLSLVFCGMAYWRYHVW